MQGIEINTAQNVVIRYELAAFRDRLLAFLLDQAILWVSYFILLFLGMAAVSWSSASYVYYLVLMPLLFFYSLASEIIGNGQSIGKLALGIKVVKMNGKECGMSDYLVRWAFRIVDIWLSLGSLASILISSTEKNQRLGDIVGNTAVIRLRPSLHFRMNDLLNINSLENYQPVYAGVRQLSEDDMIVLKSLLERCRRHNNRAHIEALNQLVQRLKDELSLTEVPKNKMEFLRTLLKDYIVLTR